MPKTKEEIEKAFLEDHRKLIAGLTQILDALVRDDLAAAVREAEDLDRRIGPHMRFEEEEYYPRLRGQLGDEFVGRLRHEHEEGRSGILKLLMCGDAALDAAARAEVSRKLRTALDHALSCGTLLSHLDSFDEPEQRQLLERLRLLQERGARWTEIAGAPAPR